MLLIVVYLYPSLQWAIGPSSFSHIENCGSKDPVVSLFFRILQRFSIYSVEPFRSRPIWALLVFIWPMFLSLFRESTAAKHRDGKIHKREKDPRAWLRVLGAFFFFLSLITHHSSLNFYHSSLIIHHLKYPSFPNPTHLAPKLNSDCCFVSKNLKKKKFKSCGWRFLGFVSKKKKKNP